MSNSFMKSIKNLLMEFLKDEVEIKFVPTHPDSKLPKRNLGGKFGTGDSGFDLYSVEDITLEPKSITKVDIGLEVSYMTPGYWFRIESRSGLYFKHKVTSFSGIIDNCVPRGTYILTTNGNIKVEELYENYNMNEIYSFSEENLSLAEDRIKEMWIEDGVELTKIITESEEILVPENKQLFTKRGWVYVKDLLEDDQILSV